MQVNEAGREACMWTSSHLTKGFGPVGTEEALEVSSLNSITPSKHSTLNSQMNSQATKAGLEQELLAINHKSCIVGTLDSYYLLS